MPFWGPGRALYQPMWSEDVAACVTAVLAGRGDEHDRLELAGPETLSYDDMARITLGALHRRRRLLHVPLPIVKAGLGALERIVGGNAFATWEEAELMEIPMITPRGTADVEALGVDPRPMRAVLGA